MRADFENKRKTEVYYGFYNGHTGADRVCSQCGSRTGGNSCFKKTQDGSDRERGRGEVASKKSWNADDGRRDDLVCDCGHFSDLCKRVSESDPGTFCNDWIRTGWIPG